MLKALAIKVKLNVGNVLTLLTTRFSAFPAKCRIKREATKYVAN